MARGHEIKIAADTRDFERGIHSGIIDPLDDAERSLDQLGDAADAAGRDGSRGLDKIGDAADDTRRDLEKVQRETDDTRREMKQLGDTADDAGREGERGIERLERALKDAQRQSERTEDAVDDIGVGGSSSMGRLGEAAGEVTQEIGSNLGEAVSSIRGNMADLGQVGQDTLGGLAATLAGTGPAGIAGAAALAAGAVGLGLVTAELEQQQEEVQRLKEYFAEAWQEAVEGGHDYIASATIIGEMNDLIFNPERQRELNQLEEDANALHLDRNLLLRAAAGDQSALNVVLKKTNEYTEQFGTENALAAQHVRDLNNRWDERSRIFEDNKSKAESAERAMYDYVTTVGIATGEVDDLGNAIYQLPDKTEMVVDAKTGKANQDIDAFERNAQGIKDKNVNVNVRANLGGAAAQVDRWIARNNGRSIKIYGKYVSPPGSDVWP